MVTNIIINCKLLKVTIFQIYQFISFSSLSVVIIISFDVYSMVKRYSTKQDAFRCHQQPSLHIARLLTGTLTLVVASHKRKITIDVQIFNLFLFAIGYD